MGKSRMILLVSLIISLGVMGVGYAAWTDQITMKIGISTGHTDLEADTSWLDKGHHHLKVEVNEKDIEITGEVYPGFHDTLKLDIMDVGTVPLVFKKVEGDNNDVISLEKRLIKPFSNETLNTNELRESFDLSIRVEEYHDTSFNRLSVAKAADEIESLEKEIEILKKRIEAYKDIDEEYEFNYKLLFEQIGSGSWSKEVTVSGKIKVVADPEVLEKMESELEGMKEKLKVLKGEELEEEEIEEIEEIQKIDEEEILEETREEIESNPVEKPVVDEVIEEEVVGEEVVEEEFHE